MPPLSLSDAQMSRLLAACAPLAVSQRRPFLEALAADLRQHPEIGDGTVDRAIRETQRQFWQPPDLSRVAYSRWRRG